MKHLLPVLATLLLLAACRTVRISDFHTSAPTPEPLPRLGLEVHVKSSPCCLAKKCSSVYW